MRTEFFVGHAQGVGIASELLGASQVAGGKRFARLLDEIEHLLLLTARGLGRNRRQGRHGRRNRSRSSCDRSTQRSRDELSRVSRSRCAVAVYESGRRNRFGTRHESHIARNRRSGQRSDGRTRTGREGSRSGGHGTRIGRRRGKRRGRDRLRGSRGCLRQRTRLTGERVGLRGRTAAAALAKPFPIAASLLRRVARVEQAVGDVHAFGSRQQRVGRFEVAFRHRLSGATEKVGRLFTSGIARGRSLADDGDERREGPGVVGCDMRRGNETPSE